MFSPLNGIYLTQKPPSMKANDSEMYTRKHEETASPPSFPLLQATEKPVQRIPVDLLLEDDVSSSLASKHLYFLIVWLGVRVVDKKS